MITSNLNLSQRLGVAQVQLKKLESELDNVKDTYFKLAQRVLQLELVVSILDQDGSLMEVLHPSPPEHE